jgi:hypothetical protein
MALSLLGLLFAVEAMPLFVPVASAQVTIVGNVPEDLNRVLDEILTQLVRAGTVALFNAAQTFLGQLAYDAADYIASGGKGQGALVQARSPGDYFSHVGQDALGSAIGSLSQNFFQSSLGFDLCRPPDPRNLLNLQISLGGLTPGRNGAFSRPRPTCDFQQVLHNYNQFFTTLSSIDLLQHVNASFNTNSSELGATLQIFGRTTAKVATDVQKAAQDRGESGAFKSVTDIISGNVKTPAALVAEQTQQTLVSGPAQDEGARRNAILSSAAEQGPIQLVTYTASMFINTLGSKLMNRIMSRGLVGAFDFSDLNQQTSVATANADAVPSRSRNDARRANLDLKDVNLIRQSNVEVLSDLIACPDVRGTWNCTMDQQLAQAISGNGCDNGTCTIATALSKGLLKGDWKLFPDTLVRENQDRNCYQQAYCAGNLRKLRLMRVLPVGFEFAANDDANLSRCASAQGCVTLKEVVDGFSSCNVDGERDGDHPWCKLIDPNWTLTMFPQQCRLTGYGDTLVSEKLGQRTQECQDIQTCLQRDDKGECTGGYGYCVAEKTVYRFGADECPAQQASCRVYADAAGQQVAFLRNTLNYDNCSADDVGCLGYATRRTADASSWVNNPATFTYFDNTLKPCSAQDEGCTKLLAADVGASALNLLVNASFERLNSSGTLVGWSSVPAGSYVAGTSSAGQATANGSLTLALTSGVEYFERPVVYPGRVMTMSLYARSQNAGDTPTLTLTATQYDASGARIPASIINTLFKSPSCIPSASDPALGLDPAGIATVGTDWTRFTCSFLTASSTASVEVRMQGSHVLVDAAELEDGQYATPFIDGVNTALPVVHMKVAPEDISCTGASSDPAICAKFAQSCRQVDAGCQGYKDNQGSPEIPAILSSNDLCPASCVGYAEFRKQPSSFDLVNDPDPRFSDPTDNGKAYFIPSTGKSCKVSDVGCETFTNLEAAASGGEQSPSFSYLRLCEKPDATLTQTYFTWEGSDTAGYQLRTWSLVSTGGTGSGPKIVARRGPDGTFKDPASCNESLWRTGFDPDCRQFYDRTGTVFYAYESQTVLSNDQCVSLRIGFRSDSADCGNTGGSFDTSTGQCTYHALPSQSLSCSAPVAGCRAYSGSQSGNVTAVVNEDFRSGRGSFTAGAPSSESLLVGDQSLRLQSGGGSSLVTSVPFASQASDLFRVSFWAKGAANGLSVHLQLQDASTPGSSPVDIGTANLSGEWQRFSFGLFNGYSGTATSSLVFTLGGPGTPIGFIDQVRVERVQDTAYVVADSWNTPAECDRTFAGIPEPQAMLGCREYTDRFNNKVNADRFTNLCSQQAIGCRAFVDTRNSDSPEAQTFVMGDATPVPTHTFASGTTPVASDFFPNATTTRPADRMVYLIYDTSKLCQPEADSCRAFGKPKFSTDLTSIPSFDTVYFKDDITAYGTALCRPSEQFCSEFSYNGAKDYFKDPESKTCEYKENLHLSGLDFGDNPDPTVSSTLGDLADGTYSGWFRTGTNVPCYPANLQSGNFFGLPKRGDEPYTGWVGTCDPQFGECTEFRDPNDTSDPDHRTGKPYFFVNNSKLDKTTCSSNYDLGAGCILLSDTSDPAVRYSTRATDQSYRDNSEQPVQPVDCNLDPTNPNCQARCVGKKITRIGTSTDEVDFEGATCNSDSDCALPAVGNVSYDLKCVQPKNDANILVKVKTDRDCAQWLGCSSAETVFDTATNQYKDVCTDLALCDKSSGKPNDIFCAHYVDRSEQKTEPVLYQGAFFDANVYSSRSVGLGQKDYDGYAVPNSFQIPDTRTARVGVDGALSVKNNQNTFSRDYRLAAVIQILVKPGTPRGSLYTAAETGPNFAFVLDPATSTIAAANPSLFLCEQAQTGVIGYYLNSERLSATNNNKHSFNCYVPVRDESDSYNFQNLVNAFALANPNSNAVLSKAFPEPECRSEPEADSPFPASFVTGWDASKNPPAPTSKLAGFENAKTCEYGEDCSCNYKRAEYEVPTLTKFYGALSAAVPPGVCFGGPRDGQSCLPSAVLQTSGGSAAVTQGIQAANADQLCGDPTQGGRCVATTKIQIIRGIFGQCLERDTTRILGGDRTQSPCLTWDPNPILFGDKDAFHYQPTSGYLPPQNSGQYYCVSPSKNPTVVTLGFQQFRRYNGSTPDLNPPSISEVATRSTAHPETTVDCSGTHCRGDLDADVRGAYDSHGYVSASYYVGKMSKLHYDKEWLSPENRCDPQNCEFWSSSIDGFSNFYGTSYRDACTNAKEVFDGGDARFSSPVGLHEDAIRLVDAGDGYRETFYSMNTSELMRSLGGFVDGTNASVNEEDVDSLLSDNSIGYFQLTPMSSAQHAYYLGCGYQAGWADNVPAVDYSNDGSIRQADHAWKDGFNRDFTGFLTRSSESVLSSDGHPLQAPCADDHRLINGATTTAPGGGVISNNCYFKTWQVGYHDQGRQEFGGIFTDSSQTQIGRSLLNIREHPIKNTCTGSPYFAIRAVYQSPVERTTSGGGSAVADPQTLSPQDVQGPWRFVGFWVSACSGPAEGDQRYIYFNIKLGTADVCRQLAEVQSSGSRQDAAFTDRVWSQGAFREQNIGTTYGDAASPFASAINTKPAGATPLFQTGQELAGFSPLNPPAFLRSGITTYYVNAKYPRDKWAYLTNLFARIYRIYQFHYAPVLRGGTACTAGPFKGTACSQVGNDPICSVNGTCKPGEVSPADLNAVTVCNRGPEAGIQCQNDTECKAATFRNAANNLTPLLKSCGLATGWSSTDPITDPNARFTLGGGSPVNRLVAADRGAFACATGAVTNPDGTTKSCTIPTGSNVSPECPTSLTGTCTSVGVGTSGAASICEWDRATYGADFDAAGLSYSVVGANIVQVNGRNFFCSPTLSGHDCNFTASDLAVAACGPAKDEVNQGDMFTKVGRCSGGLKAGQLCVTSEDGASTDADACGVNYGGTDFKTFCTQVDTGADHTPIAGCYIGSGSPTPNTNPDPDTDNNSCTNSGGYQPRPDLCPNPNDEYCGLIAYKINDYTSGGAPTGSLDPNSVYPLPTDVTLGHYTPTFLGFPTSASLNAATFSYITYYSPRPPRVAAPDTRNCAVPGQCPISRLDAFSLDNQSDGTVTAGGGQHQASLRFYGWAAHNQMPLRQIMIDWGDGKIQTIDDTKLKNRKPFCGVQKECSLAAGLTCQSDTDCPPGTGTCVQVGTCANSPQRTCTSDADCTVAGVKDSCRIRTMFGNSTDACQQDYFDFSHVYTCGAAESNSLPQCGTNPSLSSAPAIPPGECYLGHRFDGFLLSGIDRSTLTCSSLADCQHLVPAGVVLGPGGTPGYEDASCGSSATVTRDWSYCSRDNNRGCHADSDCAKGDTCLSNLSPSTGCFDPATNSCHFTPRLMLQDNWGWCTGECRAQVSGGALVDTPGVTVQHPYGGCYTGNVLNGASTDKIRYNTQSSVAQPGGPVTTNSLYVMPTSECSPGGTGGSARPWIIYPGSLELRRSNELSP